MVFIKIYTRWKGTTFAFSAMERRLWPYEIGLDQICSKRAAQPTAPRYQCHYYDTLNHFILPELSLPMFDAEHFSQNPLRIANSCDFWLFTSAGEVLPTGWQAYAHSLYYRCQISYKWHYQVGRFMVAAFSWIPNRLICLLFYSTIQQLKSKRFWKPSKHLLPFSLPLDCRALTEVTITNKTSVNSAWW